MKDSKMCNELSEAIPCAPKEALAFMEMYERQSAAMLREQSKMRFMVTKMYDKAMKEPPLSRKGLQSCSESLPYKLMCFALGVSNIAIFFLNSNLISKGLAKLLGLFGIECRDKILSDNSKEIGEAIVLSVLCLYFFLLISFKIKEFIDKKRDLSSDISEVSSCEAALVSGINI